MEVLVTLTATTCVDCGVTYAVPADMLQARRGNHRNWYCPNGHTQYFPAKSEAELLRDKLRQTQAQLAEFEHQREARRQKARERRAARK